MVPQVDDSRQLHVDETKKQTVIDVKVQNVPSSDTSCDTTLLLSYRYSGDRCMYE